MQFSRNLGKRLGQNAQPIFKLLFLSKPIPWDLHHQAKFLYSLNAPILFFFSFRSLFSFFFLLSDCQLIHDGFYNCPYVINSILLILLGNHHRYRLFLICVPDLEFFPVTNFFSITLFKVLRLEPLVHIFIHKIHEFLL